jgi:hypothetical protein
MKKHLIFILLLALPGIGADNAIYIDQSSGSSNSNFDFEQLGSANIIGGLSAVQGSMTALDLDGTDMTLDINMIGNTNKYFGDIWADSYTGFFEFDGDSNTFTMQTDPGNTYGADSSNVNVDVTGSSNTMILNQATSALASNADLDWIVNGASNAITTNLNVDSATNYINLDGNSNAVTYTGTGYAGAYFWLDHDGSNRTFTINQASTQDNDWLKIQSVGTTTSSVCVNQNDQGSAVGC